MYYVLVVSTPIFHKFGHSLFNFILNGNKLFFAYFLPFSKQMVHSDKGWCCCIDGSIPESGELNVLEFTEG